MAEKIANFVPVSVLDKRKPTKREILRGLVRQAPFVAKNFRLYFRNAWWRNIIGTKVVAPYAVTFLRTNATWPAVTAHKKSRMFSARNCPRPRRLGC